MISPCLEIGTGVGLYISVLLGCDILVDWIGLVENGNDSPMLVSGREVFPNRHNCNRIRPRSSSVIEQET